MARLYDRLMTRDDNYGLRGDVDAVRRATVVIADNVSEYFFCGTDQEEWDIRTDFPCLTPPFKNMWIECRRPSRIRSEVYGEQSPRLLPRCWGAMFGLTENPAPESDPRWRWRVNAYLYVRSDYGKSAVGPLSGVAFFLDNAGRVVQLNEGGWHAMVKLEDGPLAQCDDDTLARITQNLINPLMLAICFMHCKNVTQEVTSPPVALSRKWQKKHGRPLVRYHVLDIDPMRSVLRHEGQEGTLGLKKALHICRGHFATYTEAAPLFGKVTGTFWKPQHIRGTSSAGIVMKDYNIKASHKGETQ